MSGQRMSCCRDGAGTRRWLTLASGLLECLCFAGIIFGWASLVFVLKAEGYFGNLCTNGTAVNSSESVECNSQDDKFSLVFTIASFLNNFLLFPNGFFFDRFGTMATRLLAIVLYTTGVLMVAFSSAVTPNLLFPAMSCIAVGGVLFLMTNMQVGNLFGTHRSTIITLYNGAFDSSSGILLIIKVLFEGGITLQASMLFLAGCSVIHLLRTLFLMPRGHISHPLPEGYTYGIGCGRSRTYNMSAVGRPDYRGAVPGDEMSDNLPTQTTEPTRTPNTEKVASVRSCILSWFFMLHLVWLSIMQLRHYLFIGTLNPMLIRLTDGDPTLVSKYTNAFAFTQLCGILCAPWNGLIMDRNKGKPRAPGETEQEADVRSTALSLFITATQCLLFSLCASLPVLPLQYLTFVLQVINRSFLYGGSAAFISIAFPASHFGKLYGLIMALSALVSLLQYPFFTLVQGPLNRDPLYLNVALTVLTTLTFIHPLYVFIHCRRAAARRRTSAQ
ncbi:solute carrier family 43 member 3b [Brienomyrus brachyistius]|uniref:solute carrier family 43 member 3b n=1 Tax=Brienomyrus brachyistius TaxID=42636 RepID=UPI0020B3D427|nr:solute carrier family 43 member 3b [Brienomyrus brachyistius]XP_048826565.1 solute carrier family 43 member 3b [Brienomyrus brachyistius]XP_048826566.1 solute carrier family 43 member 3b [Brienomyrus brachyistius]XP_048826567.1 solute carrier family 43 member 3b [Brienomyrus brachyistius]XP_048826568.1 solute carrier family 43 member 3b [Brienomyrus brachyistius]XP_048826569.1 solute carrier family 43 member 3b [Brienomyrus brachyistius]XP_048826570.1 solute carrier family 43 member 3b [Br